MAFDAFFLSAVLDEIQSRTAEARVDKIHQPSRDTVILQLKCRDGREKLLFALNPTAPRLHLTTASPENPAEPPMFCMLLRKHLLGARLVEIQRKPMERWAAFVFDCIDETAICTYCHPRGGSSTACAGSVWMRVPSERRCRDSTTSSPAPSRRQTPWNGEKKIM